jgi:hypothetical protein
MFSDKFTGRRLTFSEYCLSESLRPIKTVFGTDLHNHKWYNKEDLYWTFFKTERYYYCVTLENGQVEFATSDIFDEENFSNWFNVAEAFDFDERKISSASKIFSNVMYIVIQGLNTFDIDEFYFYGYSPALGTLYQRMVYHNKFFLDSIKDNRFIFDREEDNKYFFKRLK